MLYRGVHNSKIVNTRCAHIFTQHVRHFLKIKYVNRGIDFLDLPSIFRDKHIVNKIPLYFNNAENPMICYKYKKPIRGLIFNYNKLVSNLGITVSNPTSWSCSASPFCYKPAGHIVTGDLDLIVDKRIRNILSKGPKYRLPDDIDFNACCEEIHESLDMFTSKWCKREGTDNSALNDWKLAIVNIIDKRVKFYSSNPSCLPRKNKFQFKHLINGVKIFMITLF